jgi:RecA/RadA recombinase
LPPKFGGLNGKAVYLNSEGIFPSTRLHSLSNGIQEKFCEGVIDNNIKFGDGVFVEKLNSLDGLVEIISPNGRIDKLIEYKNIKLIVLDSIASLMRTEFSKEQASQRKDIMHKISSRFKQIACQKDLIVLIINQVSDLITNEFFDLNNEKTVIPVLGLAWSNFINMRIMLSKTRELYNSVKKRKFEEEKGNVEIYKREFSIIFSSYLPNLNCKWVVEESSLYGID